MYTLLPEVVAIESVVVNVVVATVVAIVVAAYCYWSGIKYNYDSTYDVRTI